MATYTWSGLKLTQKLSLAWAIGSLQTVNLGILLLPDINIGARLFRSRVPVVKARHSVVMKEKGP